MEKAFTHDMFGKRHFGKASSFHDRNMKDCL